MSFHTIKNYRYIKSILLVNSTKRLSALLVSNNAIKRTFTAKFVDNEIIFIR